MKALAAVGVFLGFACLIGLGMVSAVQPSGSLWLLLIAVGLFLLGFIRYGCLHH